MLTQMEVFNSRVTAPPWPIAEQDVGLDPIQIKKISGLTPVIANINTQTYGSTDGGFFTGSNAHSRNIVITAALNPNWAAGQSYEGLRRVLYSYFMPKNRVKLRFSSTHMDTIEIEGYVEAFEVDPFSKDSEYQISILCPKPYFISSGATVISGQTGLLADPGDPIEIDYHGDIPGGFIVSVTLPDGAVSYSSEVRIINYTDVDANGFKYGSASPIAISTSQYFEWSSVEGDKYMHVVLLPSGEYSDALSKMYAWSSWPVLRPGKNSLAVLTSGESLNYTISYYARYGGL